MITITPAEIKEYAGLKILDKKTKARIAELQPEILRHLVGHELDKLPTNLGTFSVKKASRWQYSPAVDALAEQLEALKEREKADGTATATTSEQLEFREAKSE